MLCEAQTILQFKDEFDTCVLQITRKPLQWPPERENPDFSNLKKCFGEHYRTAIAEKLTSLN